MKQISLFFLCICFTILNCKQTSSDLDNILEEELLPIEIKNTVIDLSKLKLNQNTGIWYYKQFPFSGYAIKHYLNQQLAEKTGFHQGKRQGFSRKWFSNGVLRYESYYQKNRLEGDYKSWWPNGQQFEELQYKNGLQEGYEKKWYATGQLAKQRKLLKGQESGMQKAWLSNGDLYVNYEAKNGRTFGLQRSNACYLLKNEKLVLYNE